jgi:histidinol-phosphate aminotransferase
MITRRSFVMTLGAGGAGALAASTFVSARGREALAGARGAGLHAVAAPRAPAAAGAALIRLDSNENPNGPGKAALAAIQGALPEANRYPDMPESDLRDAVARHHGLPPECVLMGCGSTEVLRMVVQAFTSASRPLITAAPTFEDPAVYAQEIGAPVVAVPVGADLRLDLAAMAAQSAGAGLIYFCNPNNPTATVHPLRAVEEFVANVLKASPQTTILVDEAYHEYVEDPGYATAIPLARKQPRVIVSRTFSKVHGMAGLRIGYAAGDTATLVELARHKLASGVNGLGAAAAMASLGDPDHVASERQLNREAREFTRRSFEAAGYKVFPSETNFMMVDIRRDARAFKVACKQRGVSVGRPFPPLTSYTRISLGTMDEMRRAVEVFRDVLAKEP